MRHAMKRKQVGCGIIVRGSFAQRVRTVRLILWLGLVGCVKEGKERSKVEVSRLEDRLTLGSPKGGQIDPSMRVEGWVKSSLLIERYRVSVGIVVGNSIEGEGRRFKAVEGQLSPFGQQAIARGERGVKQRITAEAWLPRVPTCFTLGSVSE